MDAITTLDTPDHRQYGGSISHLDTAFDAAFKQHKGLTWLPWVGDLYQTSPSRMLLLGESNYNWEKDKTSNPQSWALVDEEVNHQLLTRIFVAKHALGKRVPARFSKNIERLLLDEPDPQEDRTTHQWRSSSYLNLVQRPMTSQKMRPEWSDFAAGWKVVFPLIDLLKPRIIIHAGTGHLKRAAFHAALIAHAGVIRAESCSPPISKTFGMSFRITTMHGHQVHVVMVMHPSSPNFSRLKWGGNVAEVLRAGAAG